MEPKLGKPCGFSDALPYFENCRVPRSAFLVEENEFTRFAFFRLRKNFDGAFAQRDHAGALALAAFARNHPSAISKVDLTMRCGQSLIDPTARAQGEHRDQAHRSILVGL